MMHLLVQPTSKLHHLPLGLENQGIDMTQMSDGTWVAYVVDHETATKLQGATAPNANDDGFEYGVYCDGGLGAQGGNGADSGDNTKDYDITTNPSFYQGGQSRGSHTLKFPKSTMCYHTVNLPHAGTVASGGQIQFSVLEDPAALNTNSGTGTNNSGNRNIVVNSTNGFMSAWPFIQAMNFSSTMATTYGGEEVSVNWGNARDYSIAVDRTIVPDAAQVALTLTDPGLNYDPTSADVWIMDASNETLYFWNNGSNGDDTGQATPRDATATITGNVISNDGNQNGVISTTQMGFVCGNDCTMSVGGSPGKILEKHVWTNITLTETGNNTGVFESSDLVTASQGFTGSFASDSSMTLTYGNTVQLIAGYEDASLSLEAGDSWLPVETANFTLTDPDENKDTGSAETLSLTDADARIPTIVIGSPLTLGDNVKSTQKTVDEANKLAHSGVTASAQLTTDGGASSMAWYKTSWDNTTDNSKRLKVIVDGLGTAAGDSNLDSTLQTVTWVNVTTEINPSALVDLEGTVLVSYDVTSLANALGSTDINAMMTHGTPAGGMNATVDNAASGSDRVICLESSGNVASAIVDLDELTGGDSCGVASYATATQRVGVHGIDDVWGSALQTNLVSFAFQFTHPVKSHLAGNGTCNTQDCYGEHAIAVDIMNFDQDNSSKNTQCYL